MYVQVHVHCPTKLIKTYLPLAPHYLCVRKMIFFSLDMHVEINLNLRSATFNYLNLNFLSSVPKLEATEPNSILHSIWFELNFLSQTPNGVQTFHCSTRFDSDSGLHMRLRKHGSKRNILDKNLRSHVTENARGLLFFYGKNRDIW